MGAVDLTARIDSEMHPDDGTTVEFGFDEADLYLFDDTTGESLKIRTGDTDVGYDQYVRAER